MKDKLLYCTVYNQHLLKKEKRHQMEVENTLNTKENDCNSILEQSIKIDLSYKKLTIIPENLQIPLSLTELNLSYNNLVEVPQVILTLKNIKKLVISHNNIEYFDDTPSFCSQIEHLDISHNNLQGPPYWVWIESLDNLMYLDLSHNMSITRSFKAGYFEELVQYECLVKHVKINNCNLNNNYIELLGTFSRATELEIGTEDLTNLKWANRLPEIPDHGLEKCCNIKQLNVCNTDVFFINSNVNIFINLKEVNLTQNRLSGLPKEFCELHQLEVCLLSFNSIMYLPDEFDKLQNLIILSLDSNEICMLPNINRFPNLIKLDLYDNKLYDVPEGIDNILEIDLAQNFFDEPTQEHYLNKRNKLRTIKDNRIDGRKDDIERCDTPWSRSVSEDELTNLNSEHCEEFNKNSDSSEEDWDSDDYWVPYYMNTVGVSQSPWLSFVYQKMAEGNFCPMDSHPVSVVDKVKYEKLCYPHEYEEVEGQFDDYSGDES